MLGNGPFNLPPLMVSIFCKVPFHLTPIGCFRPLPSGTPFIERDQRGGNTVCFSTESVVMFGIVAGIGEQPGADDLLSCLVHQGGKLRRVLAWTLAGHCPGKQVGGPMACQR